MASPIHQASKSNGGCFRLGVLVVSAVLSILGCKKKPAAAPTTPKASINELTFPVILVFGDSSVLIKHSAEGLQSMHSNYVNLHGEKKKWLIDSGAHVYSLTNLHSTRSGLGQMMNPSGNTPVAFDLEFTASSLDQAKTIITSCKYLPADVDETEQIRTAISKAGSIPEMVRLLQPEEPATRPVP